MIASLMMYARPETADAHARLWSHIHTALATHAVAAPAALSQSAGEFEVWEDPALVLSQTCGMPFRTMLHKKVQLVCTPDYGLKGCPAGYYRSAVVIRKDDPRTTLEAFAGARLAFNMSHSQSGFAAIFAHAQPSGFWFGNRIQSGGHWNSATMIAQGEADIASLDAQTWRLIQRYAPWADTLRVLDYTTPTPGLPYITGPAHDPDVIFSALQEALNIMPRADKDALDLKGFVRIPEADYLAVPNPPNSALF